MARLFVVFRVELPARANHLRLRQCQVLLNNDLLFQTNMGFTLTF